MSGQGGAWLARQASTAGVLLRDQHRLFQREGPIGRIVSKVRSAAGLKHSGYALADLGEGGLSPKEFDAMRAGVGRAYRMTLIPKRNLFFGLWCAAWNVPAGVALAVSAVPACTAEGVVGRGSAAGALPGFCRGVWVAAAYLSAACVASPLLHGVGGLFNMCCGVVNIFTNGYAFDPERGRYRRPSIEEIRVTYGSGPDPAMLDRLIMYEADFRHHNRQHAAWLRTPLGKAYSSIRRMLARKTKESAGKSSAAAFGIKDSDHSAAEDYYDVLQVPRDATTAQIKASYTSLAKRFHPDTTSSDKEGARAKFEELTRAYKTLSDSKTREAYDLAGPNAAFAAASRSEASSSTGPGVRRVGRIATLGKEGQLVGTPQEVAQALYGGVPFAELIVGPIFRSPYHLNTGAHCRVGIADFEHVQVSRMKRVALVLGSIVDAHAMDDILLTLLTASKRMQQGLPRNVLEEVDAALSGLKVPASRGVEDSTANLRGKKPAKGMPLSGLGRPVKGEGAPESKGKTEPTPTRQQQLPEDPRTLVSAEYRARLDKFAVRLSKCCFGQELLFEAGEAYTMGARRFLGTAPFYGPKRLSQAKIFTGFSRFTGAVRGELTEDGMGSDTAYNVFAMEWDNVASDCGQVFRWAVLSVAGDESLPVTTRREIERHVGSKGPRVSGKVVTLPVVDGFHVQMPAGGKLSTGSPEQQGKALAAATSVWRTLDERGKHILTGLMSATIQERRLHALLALGHVFTSKGRRFGFRDMEACTTHMKTTIGGHNNTTLPPIF